MKRPSLDAARGFDRAVYVVAGGRLLNVFGSGLVYPFATVHFHLQVGLALSLVGLGLLANNVALATGTAVGGHLADRWGRKPVMVASMALSTVSLAAYALVRTAPGFVTVATAAGLTAGLYAPASQAALADLTDADERERGYGLLKVASNAGFGSGFVVGGLLYQVAGVAVFVLDGLTSGLVAALLVVALPRLRAGRSDVARAGGEATDSPRRGASASLRAAFAGWTGVVARPRVLGLAALNVGFAVMYAQMNATVPVVAKGGLGLTAAQLGTLYVLNPLVLVICQLPALSAVGAWRRTRGLVASAGFWAASMVVVWGAGLPVSRSVAVALVGGHLVLRTVGEILHAPLVASLASDLGGGADRGTQLSTMEVAKRLGMGAGAAIGGAFFDAGAADLLWLTLVGGCLAVAVGLLVLERTLTPAENGVGGDGAADAVRA
ncbi:MAG: MFS transporter [Haloferacaceae archaeon]